MEEWKVGGKDAPFMLTTFYRLIECYLVFQLPREGRRSGKLLGLRHRDIPFFGAFAELLIDRIRYINPVCESVCA